MTVHGNSYERKFEVMRRDLDILLYSALDRKMVLLGNTSFFYQMNYIAVFVLAFTTREQLLLPNLYCFSDVIHNPSGSITEANKSFMPEKQIPILMKQNTTCCYCLLIDSISRTRNLRPCAILPTGESTRGYVIPSPQSIYN